MTAPKTKEVAGILRALKCDGGSLLLTTAKYDLNVYKSARNIDRVDVSPVAELNAWAILRPRKVLITKAALDAFRQRVPAAKAAS